MQLTKKRGGVEVFKDTDHIVVATTGIHPGNSFLLFGSVGGVILQILDHQGLASTAGWRIE